MGCAQSSAEAAAPADPKLAKGMAAKKPAHKSVNFLVDDERSRPESQFRMSNPLAKAIKEQEDSLDSRDLQAMYNLTSDAPRPQSLLPPPPPDDDDVPPPPPPPSGHQLLGASLDV
jgi:hypothetical protein